MGYRELDRISFDAIADIRQS